MAIAVKKGACINELSSMDPLLEAPLRLASISSPKGVSTTQAKDAVKFFIEDYKLRAGNNTNSSAPDTQDVSHPGMTSTPACAHDQSHLPQDSA